MICISACRNGLNRQSGKSWRKEGGKETFKTKICTKCGEEKPLTRVYWRIRSSGKDGFHSWCKICAKEYNKKYLAISKNRLRTQQRITKYIKKVLCEQKNELITRHECLDYSGSHIECSDCETGIATKKMILGDGDGK